jgi:hypothetical protein
VPGFAREQSDLSFSAARPLQAGQRSRLAEARFAHHRFPLRTLEQWLIFAQIAIGEVPPAAGQAEDRFDP